MNSNKKTSKENISFTLYPINENGEHNGSIKYIKGEKGKEEIISYMLYAASNKNYNLVEPLIDLCRNVDSIPPDHDFTLLMYAARHGNLKIVKKLVAQGSDLEIVDCESRSALSIAAYAKNYEIVEFLLQNGAKVEYPCDNAGPLVYATDCKFPSLDIVKILIRYGADVEGGCNKQYPTPLMNVIMNIIGQRRTKLIQCLLDAGADINKNRSWEGTALMVALGKGAYDIAKKFIKMGADVNARLNRGPTVFMNFIFFCIRFHSPFIRRNKRDDSFFD